MNRKMRLSYFLTVLILLAPLCAGCADQGARESFIYVDGARGCKQVPAPVPLWQEAGAAAVGSETIGQIPHGVRLSILDETSRFGITFYLVEYEGQEGWLPINFTDKVTPLCEQE